MNKAHRELLRKNFEDAANAYAEAFCGKHGHTHDPGGWLHVGGVLEVGDMFVDLFDMRTDIDTDAPVGQFEEWYSYTLRLHELECGRSISYAAWLKGAPRPYTEAELDNIETLQHKIEAMREDLKAMCGKERGRP